MVVRARFVSSRSTPTPVEAEIAIEEDIAPVLLREDPRVFQFTYAGN
jgi:hypothetical protein